MAPILEDGIYEIRFVPTSILPPIIGGLYATGDLPNDPIRAEALGPGVRGNQTWEVKSVSDKENVFTISHPKFINTVEGTGPGPVLAGFGVSQIDDKETVVLTVNIAEFRIQMARHATGQYLIANIIALAPGRHVDTIQAINEKDQILYLQGFIVPAPLPRWEFIPVKN